MNKYKVAVIAGDGIGPEVIAEGAKILEKVAELDGSFAFDFTHYPWGCEYYLKEGRMMPEDGLDRLKEHDAIFLGAVGYPGAPCPLADVKREDIDMLFVRENSEGEYAGSGSWLYKGKLNEVVIQDGVFSRHGCERIIRYAYELARKEKKILTIISKGNALNYSMVFWDQIFKEVGEAYPDVETHSYLVDAASMFMVKDPGRFQIVITSNLFGDISLTSGQPSPVVWDWRQVQFKFRENLSFHV